MKKALLFLCLFLIIGLKEGHSQTVQNYDSRIDNLLNRYKKYKNYNNKVSVYRIQLYSGNRNNANGILEKARNIYKNQMLDLMYDQPNFKVKMGIFRSKNTAREFLEKVKKDFRSAYVLSEKIAYSKLIESSKTKTSEQEDSNNYQF